MKSLCSLLALAMTLGACSTQTQQSDQPRSMRVTQLEAITQKCGLPKSSLVLKGTDDLHVRPPADADFKNVDCMLQELKRANLPLKMGFVGNEEYDPKAANAQTH